MSRSSTRAVLVAVASASLWIGAAPAQAGLVADLSVDVTHASSGLYTYSYTLTVESSSTLGAGELDLAVSPIANLSAISAPAGWDVSYTPGSPGDSAITFSSPDSSTDLAPGTSGMFSMESLVGPALASDVVRGFDDSTGTFDQVKGMIQTASVPEPSGLVLGVLALLGAAYPVARGSGRWRATD
jgi:hypothetical protein